MLYADSRNDVTGDDMCQKDFYPILRSKVDHVIKLEKLRKSAGLDKIPDDRNYKVAG